MHTHPIRRDQCGYVSLFSSRLSCFGLFFSWWKPMDGPWATVWWSVRAYRSASPCIGPFRARPEKQWSFAGALTNQLPQVIHLGYVTAWNQLPRDGGGVTSTAERRWRVFLITIRHGPLCTRSHRDHLLDGKVLMVAQIDPINLRHRAQGAHCLAPQYVLFGRLSSNLSLKAQRGK